MDEQLDRLVVVVVVVLVDSCRSKVTRTSDLYKENKKKFFNCYIIKYMVAKQTTMNIFIVLMCCKVPWKGNIKGVAGEKKHLS